MTVERIHPKAPVMLIFTAIFTCLPSCINLSNIDLKFRATTSKFNTLRKPLMQQKYYFIHEMQLLKSSTKLCYASINRLFPVNATLICFIVVKQSGMINPVVRKINISHFKDSAFHRKFA